MKLFRKSERSLFAEIRAARRGRDCPDCDVRPGCKHRTDCPTGAWDGGVWA